MYLVIGYSLFNKALTMNSYIQNKYRLTFAWVLKKVCNRLQILPAESIFEWNQRMTPGRIKATTPGETVVLSRCRPNAVSTNTRFKKIQYPLSII
jgi:hypothetical protein